MANAGRSSEDIGVIHRAVTPTHPGGVLEVVVLGIVDQDVDPGHKIVAGGPARAIGEFPDTERRFVVGDVRQRSVPVLQPVPDRRARVAHKRGPNGEPRYFEPPERHVVEAQPAWQIPEPHREQRRRKVPAQSLAKRQRGRSRAPDVDFEPGLEQGAEESQPEDMVYVEVAEEDIDTRHGRIPCGARAQTPVPASSTTTWVGSSLHTSTHEVLPP